MVKNCKHVLKKMIALCTLISFIILSGCNGENRSSGNMDMDYIFENSDTDSGKIPVDSDYIDDHTDAELHNDNEKIDEDTDSVIIEPEPQCPAPLSIKKKNECDEIPLTDPLFIDTQSNGIVKSTGPGGSTALKINDDESIDIKDQGCLQLGKDGADFTLTMWLKASGSSQIIGTKSQYSSKQGFILHTSELSDGNLSLNATSADQQGSKKSVKSLPFKPDVWTFVVLRYVNKNAASSFSIDVNLQKTSGAAFGNVYNENLRIGDEGWGQIAPFEISELYSYSRVLSDTEIKALFLQKQDTAGVSLPELSSSIDNLMNHINGNNTLSTNDLLNNKDQFVKNAMLLETDKEIMNKAFNLVSNYETTIGPLFMTDNTKNGVAREESDDGKVLARVMIAVQQAILEHIYTPSNVAGCRLFLDGKKYLTSSYFPGNAETPDDPSKIHEATINADLPAYWGKPVAFATDPVRRPTGLYLSPGSIGKVIVPEEMVNAGFQVLVGAHTVDKSNKNVFKRLDRVTRRFPITDEITYIANPLGGGVYIVVPYLANLGIVTVKISGVIKAPFYSLKSFDKTTKEEWLERRTAPGPWADFETDKFMMQVPRSWIYKYENPLPIMQDWDKAMDGVSELFGYPPEKRNKTVLYVQVDVSIRHGAYGIGYPQVNNTYNPNTTEDGNKQHWFLTDPTKSEIEYHELGHAQLFSKFRGETEAAVNFPHCYVRHAKFGVDFETAFKQSFGPSYGNPGYSPDDAAIHWMITENFRNGREMNYTNSTKNEFRYQHRGYAKYADIYRIFGWDALRDFFHQEHLDYMNNAPDDGLDAVDSRILRLSIAAGADLTPLIHFWGIHPVNLVALTQQLTEHGIASSQAVKNHIEQYKTIAPSNNAEFNEHFERVYPGRPEGGNPDYGHGWYNEWKDVFNETHAAQIQTEIQKILDLYY